MAPSGGLRSLAARTGAQPGVIGFIDRVQGNRVSGWTLDRSHPDLQLDVGILVDGQEAARVRADRFRRDLERSGFGSGHHAFEATLKTVIEDGQAHRVEAFAQCADGAQVLLVNRPASPPPGDHRPAPESHQVLLEIRALREHFEVLAAAGSDGSPAAGGGEASFAMFAELDNLLPSLIERLDAFDAVQVRLEAAISRLENRLSAELGSRHSERGLRVAVGLLGVLSVVSMLLGLRSLLS